MNRAQRRRQQRNRATQQYSAMYQFAADYECPDCAADKTLEMVVPGVYALTVAHDDTCPMYRRMTQRK